MLQTTDLHAYYGKSHVLRGVSMHVEKGEIVSLVGRNGVGRSTLCKAVMGLVPPAGEVRFENQSIQGLPPHAIARRGLGYVPEDRAIFPGLTVGENLELGIKRKGQSGRWSYDEIYRRFPRLKEREETAAEVLSGGEQQMLTMARTLLGNPRCIIVDEPTEGLAPKVVEEIAMLLKQIAEEGMAVLLVEQKLGIALDISDRLYVMGEGRVVFDGSPKELQAAPEIRKEWLEV
ncbi:ABC transporter ATP-binding protein [Alkalilimnicola ehrlichii]|uniref:ABC transporter ATP-binding protein n=1 Tax=Alkalilimnicola ehrlichii TaxID=351052 RepID=A0A3E0WJ69_9GAMM|nr:ABC transporter ATP-binding protein [Alkalilimnicola ehrlichii]RFA25755.1 ABC transporter ATP-binding protein [Alkalilimnicola ehrlichii]RFA32838.1 ABC transporter ATP-binding protein [Alkalilimnicola ehrlichii]